MTATPETARQAPPSPVARRSRSTFGPLLLRLHFYAGIVVAPFLLLAALTGIGYAFTPQLDKAVYAHELTVTPSDTAKALSAQLTAARGEHPDGAIIAVRPGTGDATTQVDFSSPALDAEHSHTVYVNPYTAEVTGQLTTWFEETPMRTWFDGLHTHLLLGDAGYYYSEFAASWLWVIALGGVALWWRRQHGKRILRPDLAAKKGVRRTRGWHAATGLWLSIGLLFLSVTGLTWSNIAGVKFGDAVDALHGSRPAVSTELSGQPAAPATGHHHGGGATPTAPTPVDPAAIDTVLRVAAANGIDRQVSVTVPADTRTAWTVTEEDGLWPVGRDSIAVDAATGTITDRSDFADWPLMAKLTQWGIYAHMGNLFGLANQILLAALALGLICVIIWGYRMWWQRRPTRADRHAPVGAPLGERGAWQQLPAWAVIVGVPALLFVGWALPLLGIPLAAFLIADLAIAELRRRRTPAGTPVSPAPAGS
jgi:uncharacterized iron-regulated membrane protein